MKSKHAKLDAASFMLAIQLQVRVADLHKTKCANMLKKSIWQITDFEDYRYNCENLKVTTVRYILHTFGMFT